MKKVKKILASSIALSGLVTPAMGADSKPRGIDIEPIAAGCPIGDVGFTTKAGSYNKLCKELSDAEKCLAVIKSSLVLKDGEHQFVNNRFNTRQSKKIDFCLDLILDELGSDDDSEE